MVSYERELVLGQELGPRTVKSLISTVQAFASHRKHLKGNKAQQMIGLDELFLSSVLGQTT